MAARLCRGHFAPAVNDFLFLGLGVVDTSKGFDVFTKNARQFFGGLLAFGTILFGEEVQCAFDIVFVAIHEKGQTGDRFVKQLFPRIPNNTQIVQEFFHFIGQLVIFHRADAVKSGLVAGQFRVSRIERVNVIIVQTVDFQCEKDQWRGEVCDLLLGIRQEFGARAIGGHLVIPQSGKRHDAPRNGADFFVALDAGQHVLGVQARKVAFVMRCKLGAFGFKPV